MTHILLGYNIEGICKHRGLRLKCRFFIHLAITIKAKDINVKADIIKICLNINQIDEFGIELANTL